MNISFGYVMITRVHSKQCACTAILLSFKKGSVCSVMGTFAAKGRLSTHKSF